MQLYDWIRKYKIIIWKKYIIYGILYVVLLFNSEA